MYKKKELLCPVMATKMNYYTDGSANWVPICIPNTLKQVKKKMNLIIVDKQQKFQYNRVSTDAIL